MYNLFDFNNFNSNNIEVTSHTVKDTTRFEVPCPGYSKEDLKISFNTETSCFDIKGSRKDEYSSYELNLHLFVDTSKYDISTTTAKQINGILYIYIKKITQNAPKLIEIA